MKILWLRADNFKRLSVVQITPEGHVIQLTGGNASGKSSTLDAIWAALGGSDAEPSEPIHKGKKSARVVVKIGDADGAKYVVEKSFTENGSYLTVKDAEGSKHKKPQQILDGLMGAIGFDPLSFMREKPKDQFDTLRRLVKLDVDLEQLDRRRGTVFEERTALGRDLRLAEGAAAAVVVPQDLPDERPDVDALVEKLAGVEAHNRPINNAFAAEELAQQTVVAFADDILKAEAAVADAQERLERARAVHADAIAARVSMLDKVKALPKILDAGEVVLELEHARRVNVGFDKQDAKINADARVTTLKREIEEKTTAIAAIDKQKSDALAAAKMPVEGLALADGAVHFNGVPLDQASSAEQLRVSAAIGAALNPQLRVLLARDGSLLDSKSLQALGSFAEANDMQVWLERVDESGEIGVVLVDGHVKGQEALVDEQAKAEAGEPAAPAAVPVDEARLQRVNAYLDAMIEQLPSRTTVVQADRDNAEVKVKCSSFPEIIATRWTPAYLGHLKHLKSRGK